ncbi:MAG TPA: hypothetical protein VE988_12910, partial [Gemmataceae bacterium]|nr:hypothetical protein [Gemmataceae bacterium]
TTITEAVWFGRFHTDTLAIIKSAKEAMGKTEVNLYFGLEGMRKDLQEEYPSLKTIDCHFAKWEIVKPAFSPPPSN